MIAGIGSLILLASVLVFIYNIIVSMRKGKIAGPNPWNAFTLEWADSIAAACVQLCCHSRSEEPASALGRCSPRGSLTGFTKTT